MFISRQAVFEDLQPHCFREEERIGIVLFPGQVLIPVESILKKPAYGFTFRMNRDYFRYKRSNIYNVEMHLLFLGELMRNSVGGNYEVSGPS